MVDSYGFIDSKACWNSMFWTYVFHGQPVGSDKNYFFLYFNQYCRYLNEIWSAHRYNTVILAGQVSREIMQGNFLDIHTDTSLTVLSCDDQWRWKCIFSNRFAWFWCISNNFSFCQGFPAVLYLISPIAGQTGAGCRHKELLYTSSGQRTSKNLIFALKFGLLVSLYLCNKHARFYWDIFQTGPMIKIWLLENNRWLWPRKHWCCNVQFTSKIVHST